MWPHVFCQHMNHQIIWQSPGTLLGCHFRRLKAQSSKVSFATFRWKETFELWALSFETAFENVTPSGIGCTIIINQQVEIQIWLWNFVPGRYRIFTDKSWGHSPKYFCSICKFRWPRGKFSDKPPILLSLLSFLSWHVSLCRSLIYPPSPTESCLYMGSRALLYRICCRHIVDWHHCGPTTSYCLWPPRSPGSSLLIVNYDRRSPVGPCLRDRFSIRVERVGIAPSA